MEKDVKESYSCPYCGSTNIDYGTLVTSGSVSAGGLPGGDVFYRSSKKKESRVMVWTRTCIKCGHMDFYLDPIQLNKSFQWEPLNNINKK